MIVHTVNDAVLHSFLYGKGTGQGTATTYPDCHRLDFLVHQHDHSNQESELVSVRLGLLNELGPEMVRPDPLGEVGNLLRMQRDRLSPNLVQSVLSQYDLGRVHGRTEHPELGLATHM